MLTYFPAIYPDELLYSVLARYHRHIGARSDAQVMETLFGRRRVVADLDLLGALDRLAERIPPGRALHVDRILDELTLLPYYMAFQPPDVQVEVRTRLRQGQVDGLHLKLGLAAFRAGRVTRLRFCRAWTPRQLVATPVSRLRATRRPTHCGRTMRGGMVHPRTTRVDWSQRDRMLVEQVSRAATEIRARQPPVRVTTAQIERQLGVRGWFAKRRAELPLTTFRLMQLAEPLEAFQRRRVAWVADEMGRDGLASSPWRVMRRAGLTAKHMPMIERVLTRRPRHSGGAA